MKSYRGYSFGSFQRCRLHVEHCIHLHRRYCIINVLLISGSVWGVGAWRLHSFSLSSNATTTKNLIRSRGGHAIPTWALRTWSASVPLAILFCPLVLQCTTINSLASAQGCKYKACSDWVFLAGGCILRIRNLVSFQTPDRPPKASAYTAVLATA